MFKDQKETPRGSQTKLLVETSEGMEGMVIAENGHPLNQQQRQAEIARVARFINNPDELRKKQKQEKEDTERINRIMRALPDAFLYEYDGTETGKEGLGKPGDELVRLRFRPNPSYDPPSHIEQVLTGMQGVMLIDANHCRLAQINGVLAKEVGFGWGILGHLDRGGTFLVEQGEVGDNHWEITHMQLSLTGKVLVFKSLVFKSNEVFSDFRPVPPNLTFAQAFELLKKQEEMVAEIHQQDGGGK